MDTQVFKIADVERDTGLSKDVLRVWERRYGFPAPDRDRNGDRSYSAQQVEHLRLIKRLMDAGQRPGKLLGVPVEDLVRLNPAREAAVEPGAPGLEASRSVATSGLYELVAMLRSHDGDAFLRAMQQRLAGYGVHRFVLDVVAPLAAEAPASQAVAEPPPSLMDGEATRRAIRAAAREPGLAAQAGRQGPALRTPDERLGDQVQRSAKGDCLKGEYLGGGMGLLSLPFLAAAALKGDCRR